MTTDSPYRNTAQLNSQAQLRDLNTPVSKRQGANIRLSELLSMQKETGNSWIKPNLMFQNNNS